MSESDIILRRVREGRCSCCGGETEDFEWIHEGVKMCREWCIDPEGWAHRDHRDTIPYILAELNEALRHERV